MKICIILPSLLGGGAERLHILLAKEWLTQGHEVDFILLSNSGSEGALNPLVPKECKVIVLGKKRIRQSLIPLSRIFSKENYDISITAMWPLTLIPIIAKFMSSSKTKIIISDHTHLTTSRVHELRVPLILLKATIGMLYRLADAIVCVSNGVRDDIVSLGYLKKSSINVIYNPIYNENELPKPIEKKQELWSEGIKHKLLAVGSLTVQKNFSTLIQAFSMLNPLTQESSELIILGEGPQRELLQKLIKSFKLENRIKLAGFKLDPSPWFATADLFILSSSWEGFGNVIVEALHHRLPVVSTDCNSGPREILADGRFGILVDKDNTWSLSVAIEESLRSNHDLESLYNRSQDFTIQKASKSYIMLFNSLIK